MDEKPAGQLSWKTIDGHRCLAVLFPETLDEVMAEELVQRVVGELEAVGRPVQLIWDCRWMRSYSPQAFAVWRDRLPALSSRLEGICCLTNSTFIRMGARALGLAIKMNITACASESEITWD